MSVHSLVYPLTTEEELFLKHETMRDFFIQELKALRESVSSVQKAAQDDLKAFTEVTEVNFMEELQCREDTQTAPDAGGNSKTALQKVEVPVKAMEESVVNRMVTLEGKLEAALPRLTAMEADVCSSPLLSSGPVQEADTFVHIQHPSSQSSIKPTQGATFTLTRRGRTASIPVQPSASSPLLSSVPLQEVESSDELEFPTLTQSVSSGYQQQVTWTKCKLVESLIDLTADLATSLKPHMSEKISRQEKLSRLQVAYFHHQLERLKVNNTKGLYEKTNFIKEAGERDGLWSPGWSPCGSKDMQQYLAEKIKTTLKKMRRSEMVVEEEKLALKQKLQF
ncbi:hypothetical protein E1301_Tti017117 [Triplophysa tibetana]|uniref:Uncharacterized protein n=1 Tax=Triplophysa tibetana TaxID=1572043 RepID=A0A5A9NU34_9TELE|nr:hypothetical protein E1301_Tti017117 [Triplophysa tibetana]